MIRPLLLTATALVFFQMLGFSQTQPNAIPKKDFYQEKKSVEMQKSVQAPAPVVMESPFVNESLDHTHFLDSKTGEVVPTGAPRDRNESPNYTPKADAPADKPRQPSPKG